MATPDQISRTPNPEQPQPFDQAVEIVQGFLDSPRTQCYEFDEPVEVGMTNSITFGAYGASKHIGPGGASYRVRTTFGPHEDGTDTVWILDPQAQADKKAQMGREDPSQPPFPRVSNLKEMPPSEYVFLLGKLPEAFADAKANKHIGYPRRPLMVRLGALIVRRSKRQ